VIEQEQLLEEVVSVYQTLPELQEEVAVAYQTFQIQVEAYGQNQEEVCGI